MALEGARDGLYTRALAVAGAGGGGGGAAEQLLLERAREQFAAYAKESMGNPVEGMTRALGSPGIGRVEETTTAMPADVWARLAAAVQIEAARSANSKALNPDSVLLRPDPLLAPKKTAPRRESEPYELTSPSRLITAGVVVLLAGVIVTVYILTRPAGPPGRGAERGGMPAASAPGGESP